MNAHYTHVFDSISTMIRTSTSLIKNTASVKKLIVINAVSDAGKSKLPWLLGDRRIRRLFSLPFGGHNILRRSSVESIRFQFSIICIFFSYRFNTNRCFQEDFP